MVEADYRLTLPNPATGEIWQVIGFNVNNSAQAYGNIRGLAFIGPQQDWPPAGLTLTVITAGEGPSGATATPYASYVTPACFTTGTRLAAPAGQCLVENLAEGNLVLTLDQGPQPVLLVARNVSGDLSRTQ